jgi:hypothetical protein
MHIMKTNFITLIIGGFLGILLGAFLGAKYESNLFRGQIAKPEIDTAFIAAQEANWLAALRLNKTNDAIVSLENALNLSTGLLAAWNDIVPPDAKTRKERDSWLGSVKIYREHFPAEGEGVAKINSFLDSIPNLSSDYNYSSNIIELEHKRGTNDIKQ